MITLVESNASETSSLASKASLASFSSTSSDTAPSSIASCGSSLQEIKSNASEGSAKSREFESSTGPLVVRRACRFDCYCSCHSRSEVQRSGMASLSKSISQLGLSGSHCDHANCQSGRSTDGAVGSVSQFFKKALPHVVAAHGVKVRYHINTFHMVPEGSDVMRYTKQGDLDNLKAAIQSGKATLWDTAPDGWSLLHVSSFSGLVTQLIL